MAHPKPAECPTLGGQLPQVEQTQPPFLAFQMPKMEMTQLQPRLRHQPAYKPPQQQPQFVVFEVATTSYASAASSASTASFDETTGSSSTALSTLFGHGSSQMAATSSRALTVPFLPIANSAAVFQQRMADDGEEESEPFTGEIHFSTVQFILPKPSVGKKTQNRQSSSSSRLLFDNPMFRRLPNWHFFGDDRRLAQVPPFIPLFVPVERTLLSIAPSLSGIRQLVLMGMLDIKAMTTTTVHQQPDALEYNKLEDTEEEDILITSATRRCWPEESRVTTPAEEDADCISAICRAQTPTTDLAAALDEVESTTELNSNTESGCFSLETTSTTTTEATVTTASSSSVNSSAPNSPPTFDRRTVRMSRSARDAMLRLSISRRFEEEEAEQTCNNSRSSVKSGEDDSTDEQRMSLRSRHISNDSSIDNAYMQPNQAALHHHQHLLYQQQQQQPQQPFIQSKPPISIHGISCMDVLSERIYNLHQNVQQSYFHLNRKLILRDQLYYTISPVFPLCGLYIVGSSLNGFGTSNSDLDLCLMISNRDIDQRKDAVVILSSVMRILESSKMVVSLQLILAKVPILRIKCAGVFSDIMVDLNVNNSVAVRNTHLMCYYSAFDWRVRPIVMVVKEWAKRRGINNSSRSSFTSYSLVLMVIHYLQCGTNPPVLPSLQQLYPNRFSDTNDIRNLNVSQNLEPIPSTIWQFNQRLSLSELLLGFLHYYAYEFNFDIDAISIRAGMRVPRAQVAQNKSAYNTLSQWHCICIEEPFTLTNAAHSVYDQRIFEEIKKQFADSYQDLDKYRDLDSFLGEPSEESVPLEQAMLAVEPNDGGEKENEDAATVDAAMANGNSA